MNILDLLRNDHTKLRHELIRIRQCLCLPGVRDRIKHFISLYEIHESTEEELLFPVLDKLLKDLPEDEALILFRETHDHIWALLDQLMDTADAMRYSELQRVFFHFVAATEAHLGMEERILFPRIEARVDSRILEEMGRVAERRFSNVSVR